MFGTRFSQAGNCNLVLAYSNRTKQLLKVEKISIRIETRDKNERVKNSPQTTKERESFSPQNVPSVYEFDLHENTFDKQGRKETMKALYCKGQGKSPK